MIKEFLNLYNTLVNLSRNKSLFSIFTNKDTFSDRLLILLFHFGFFLRKYKNNTDKEYLQKFFDSMNGMKLTGAGEASMFTGVLGLGFLAWMLWATAEQVNGSSDSNGNLSLLPWVGRAVLICGAVHVALMGWDIWFAPEKWENYGHLPPITLLSFVTAVVFLFLRRRRA